MSKEDLNNLERKLELLSQLMNVAASSLDVAETIDEVAEVARKVIRFDRFSIAFYNSGDDFIQTYASAADSVVRMRVPLRGTTAGDAVLTGRAHIVGDYLEGPRAFDRQWGEQYGFRSAMHVPLVSKDRVIGVLNIASVQPNSYSQVELAAAQEIAEYLGVIVEHTLLYEKSKEMAKAQERNRLAREIHDTLAQGLTGIIFSKAISFSFGQRLSLSLRQANDAPIRIYCASSPSSCHYSIDTSSMRKVKASPTN